MSGTKLSNAHVRRLTFERHQQWGRGNGGRGTGNSIEEGSVCSLEGSHVMQLWQGDVAHAVYEQEHEAPPH
jgi:hypothetical protein